ncbi:hypothetical protein ZIOFF_042020 [Zingiber officinale]|uniref:Uncharacterized protein n=1 Tax=Zingiber officinale TaxID=94328 RepID=A0A8J5G8H6_ZINOF|nr:hypothetical protein ZIOFF_042020 [Zingiber officinale]
MAAAALPLSDCIAIVTGASCSIGPRYHLPPCLPQSLVYASNSAAADQLTAKLNSSSHQSARAITIHADVSDADAVRSIFNTVEYAFGGQAHILIVCAGILGDKYPTLAATTDEGECSVEGGSGGNGESTRDGAEGDGDPYQLRGSRSCGDRDVFCGEERGVLVKRSVHWDVAGGLGHRASGGVRVHRRHRVGELAGGLQFTAVLARFGLSSIG